MTADPGISDLDKAEVARRQLWTALYLYLQNCDAVSVHSLACAGGELAEHLTTTGGGSPFLDHVLEERPGMALKYWRGVRNRYWNAFKHATRYGDKTRDDTDIFASFSDEKNDHCLFVGWYDLGAALGKMPVEAQIFAAWYIAMYPEKLSDGLSPQPFQTMFPNLPHLSRVEQKAMLSRVIEHYSKDEEIMSDPRTDRRPLFISE